MKENKPVTEEVSFKDILKTKGLLSSDESYVDGLPEKFEEAGQEYVTLKTHQLQEHFDGAGRGYVKVLLENEGKIQQLTAENERLREMIGVCIVTLKCDLANAAELQEQQVSEEFNRGREAGLTYAIGMLLAYAGYDGINLTKEG